MAHVFIALPTYLARIENSGLLFAMLRASEKHKLITSTVGSSANCYAMNDLWNQALHRRGEGVTHFFMLHSDIVPENLFIDKMVAVMEKTGADILSAVIPLKDEKGLTSTALDEPMGDFPQKWRVKRLTMREVCGYPETFTSETLLVNDGCMIVDLRKPWVEKVHFHFDDDIIEHHGRRIPVCAPEDWNFSRDARALGASIWATREVYATHHGSTSFPNDRPWGVWETDTLCETGRKRDPDVQAAVDAAIYVPGYMSAMELAWLAENAKGKETVIEVGSWLGRSTKAMAMTVGGSVYAVDHWKGTGGGDATGEEAKTIDPFAEFCHNVGYELNRRKVQTIHMKHEDLSEPLTCHDGLTLDVHLVEPADLLFIDGSHEEVDVRRDIKNCVSKVKPGGILCGHDYTPAHPGVIAAVNDMLPGFQVAPGTSIWWVKLLPVDASPKATNAPGSTQR